MTACTCDAGNSAEACAQEFYSCDAATSCSACACRNCPGKYALCQETPGCPAVFDCMRSTQCQGSACQERCGSVGSGSTGTSPAAFDVAEALWACDQANACECELPPPATAVVCPGPDGDVTCNDHVASNATLVACCPNTAGTGSSAACGLDLRRYFAGARACEPRAQNNRPRTPALLELCPARSIFEPPYNGAQLPGCCNSAANTCGLYDDITGLGCLNAATFGIASQPCTLLL